MLAEGRVKLVAVAHVSNVLGTINPVAEIARRARAAGAVTLVDGAQAVPQMPVDLRAIDADFYAWTGHKALGPTDRRAARAPRAARGDAPVPRRRPHDLARGARALHLERAALEVRGRHLGGRRGRRARAAAVDYLAAIGMERVRAHERDLTAYALERLPEVEGIHLYGPSDLDRRGGVVPFTIEGIHPHDIAELCDREAVCVRAGHHCAQPLMRCLGVGATARASFHVYNSREDVDRLVDALGEAPARSSSSDGRALPRLHPRALQEPAELRELEPHDLEWHDHNPLCGDELGVHIVVEDGRIADLRFHGHGCAISQAAASIASEELIGMSLEEVERAGRRLGDRPARHRDLPHAPQVRAAVAQGDARRHHGRRQLA